MHRHSPARTPRALRTALLASFSVLPTFAATSAAQVIVVDPGGGGNFRDLQTAIQAVPSGSVLEVRGGIFDQVVIQSKSLTIYGKPAPTIRAPVNGRGVQPAALTIRGTGSEHVSLANLILGGGQVGPVSWNQVGAAMVVDQVARVTAVDVACSAPEYWAPSGQAVGAPGIAATGAGLLRLTGCTVGASTTWPAHGSNPRTIPDGLPGISTDGAVELVSCTVTGGSVMSYVAYFGQPTSSPCPCPTLGGTGGDAVRADSVHATDSTLRVGTGAPMYYEPPRPAVSWGRQPTGQRFVGRSFQTARLGLTAAQPMRVGQSWTATPTPFTGAAALLFGVPAAGLRRVGPFDLFADLAGPLAVVPLTGTALTLGVPGQVPLVGGQLAMQVVQVASASGPHYEVIRR